MDFLTDWVSLSLISIGLVLFWVAYYVRRQTLQLSRIITELYELNHKVGQDALDFFDQAWPILDKAGIYQLQASIEWFGEHRFESFGHDGRRSAIQRSCDVETEDMHFQLTFELPGYKGEKSSWLNLVVTTFIQILQQDLEHKRAEILNSQKRLERYQMFVQHEVKNIAQFIKLLSEQVADIQQDSDKLRLVNRLQDTMPVMAQRATNTIRQMNQPLHEFYQSDLVDLNALIEEVLFMYQLQAELTGEGSVAVARPVLLEVFKNILGNYRDHPVGDCPLSIEIVSENDEDVTVYINSCLQTSNGQLKSERMFEPFWTTSESGMGLGLFLTRELLKQVGGEIQFKQEENQVSFEITLRNLPHL
ncbi:ATP-binding protein [Thiomicrorhabdus sp. ZW0627]|uniref:ATP-binding protein n=1 Tax=Thiomicrorhabdus sp. ZW0627 TaxID=3039774 RepID=UPI0024367EE0|nr:ATP-binding protein [Thiomicrorhabdus sp. ZW0627]MDG6774773.1 ATP-binding protein [Thiomicrorhabdus sp. ZW0627]